MLWYEAMNLSRCGMVRRATGVLLPGILANGHYRDTSLAWLFKDWEAVDQAIDPIAALASLEGEKRPDSEPLTQIARAILAPYLRRMCEKNKILTEKAPPGEM